MTHASVKHSLLTVPSSDTLFSEEVVEDSRTQVREDSHLILMKNLSSVRGGKGSASSSFTSSQRKGQSASSAP